MTHDYHPNPADADLYVCGLGSAALKADWRSQNIAWRCGKRGLTDAERKEMFDCYKVIISDHMDRGMDVEDYNRAERVIRALAGDGVYR